MQRGAFVGQLAAFAANQPPWPEEPVESFDPGLVEAPTLLLVGSEDVSDMLEIAERLAATMPRAQFVGWEGVAHMPNLERPEEFNRLVLDFLAAVA